MLLSHYERKDSPWVWIQYGVTAADKHVLKTAIRKNDPHKKRKIAAELHRIEAQLLPFIGRDVRGGGDWRWVTSYLRSRYAGKDRTRTIYLAQWQPLVKFMAEKEITAPADLTREFVFEYPQWRQAEVKEKSKRSPKLNTALGELKLLGLVMDEAVRRHLAPENPARKLGIEREDTAIKPEIRDEELEIIWKELPREGEHHEWMTRSFELALNSGLRFMETRLHRSQVRWASDDVLIEKPKGGRRRQFAIPIYKSIRPLLRKFRKGGDEFLWTAPRGTLVGIVWRKFFVRIGLPHLSFHCTRVTFVTRGMRAGIPESVMMKMVNHAEKLINRVYQRWTDEDVRRYADLVQGLRRGGGQSQSRRGKQSRRSGAARTSRGRRNKPRGYGRRARPR